MSGKYGDHFEPQCQKWCILPLAEYITLLPSWVVSKQLLARYDKSEDLFPDKNSLLKIPLPIFATDTFLKIPQVQLGHDYNCIYLYI